MVRIKRLRVGETMTAPLFEINGIKFRSSEWIGWWDEDNNIIWLKSYATFRVLFHEILHYLTDRFIPFVRLRELIHYALIDRYPREMWFIGRIKVW